MQKTIDIIRDDERLYRRVRTDSEPQLYRYEGNTLRISSNAFNDPGQKPSVDRADLRNSHVESKIDSADKIFSLYAREVREIDDIEVAPADKNLNTYKFDVRHRPVLQNNPEGLPPNHAHAQIEPAPEYQAKSRFQKLKEKLARIAERHGILE